MAAALAAALLASCTGQPAEDAPRGPAVSTTAPTTAALAEPRAGLGPEGHHLAGDLPAGEAPSTERPPGRPGNGPASAPRPPSTPRAPTTITTTGRAPHGSCPDPRFCDFYQADGRWRTDRDGRVSIRYRINATNPPPARTDLTTAQVVDAIRAAAAAWERANPNVRLDYGGLTTEPPNPHECNNVIAFLTAGAGLTQSCPDAERRYFVGFTMTLPPNFTWRPCGNGAERCEPYESDVSSTDLQQVVTHEWGHVLGLGHPPDPEKHDQLTMWGSTGNSQCTANCRWSSTLALGDVLGVRHLYPTSAPMPGIEVP